MRAGLTQVELAESIGTATEVYGRLERGKMLPSVPTLFRLCVALRSGPHELMVYSQCAPLASLAQNGALLGMGLSSSCSALSRASGDRCAYLMVIS